MQFDISNFRRKISIFCPVLAFSVEILGISAFYDLISLKLHIRPSLNQFVVFVL